MELYRQAREGFCLLCSLLLEPWIIKTSAQQLIIIFRIDQSKAMKRKFYDQNARSGVDDKETSKRIPPPPCPLSSYNPQGAEGEGGGRAVDGTTLSEGENATARTTTTMPISPPLPPPPLPLPPPQQGNSRVNEGNVNDQDQDFQRQLTLAQEERAKDHKRRSQRACQHRLLLQLLVLLLLLCFVLGVLPQHYFPMGVSTDIFPNARLSGGCFWSPCWSLG